MKMRENRTTEEKGQGEYPHVGDAVFWHEKRVTMVTAFVATAGAALEKAGAVQVAESCAAKRLTDDQQLAFIRQTVEHLFTEWPPFIRRCSLSEDDARPLFQADLSRVVPVCQDIAVHRAVTVAGLFQLSGRGKARIHDAIAKGLIGRIGRHGNADLLDIVDSMAWYFRQPVLPRGNARHLQVEVLWRIMLLDPVMEKLPKTLPTDPDELGRILPPVRIPVPRLFAALLKPLGTGELKLLQGMLLAQMNRVMRRKGGATLLAHGSVREFVESRFMDNCEEAEAAWRVLVPTVTCPQCQYVGRFRRVGKGRVTLEMPADQHDLATVGTGDEWSSDASRETGFRHLRGRLLAGHQEDVGGAGHRVPAAEKSMELRCSRCRHEFRLSFGELSDLRRNSRKSFRALSGLLGKRVLSAQAEMFMSDMIGQYLHKEGFFACINSRDIGEVLGRDNVSVAHSLEQAYDRLGRRALAGSTVGAKAGKRDPIYWAGKNAWWIWANAYWFTWQLLGTTGLARCRYAFPNLIDGMVNAFLAKFVTGEIPFDDYEREGGKLKWF